MAIKKNKSKWGRLPRVSGYTSWLKIKVESEHCPPPRHGTIMLQLLIGVFFFVFVTRFWYLQVYRGAEFSELSLNNRMRTERIFAQRGRILDSKNQVLADNRTNYCLGLIVEDCPDIPATIAQIAEWTGATVEEAWKRYREDRSKVKSFEPLLMVTEMDFNLVAKIESELINWPGLEIIVRAKRSYPEKELFAHVLGYVAEVTEKELENDPALGMGDLIGRMGLERTLEYSLRGSKGVYQLEVDAYSRMLDRKLISEPNGGEEINLSLDRDLQRAAWRALQGETGAVVVMEPDTGKLRALVTSPAYDNNFFTSGVSKKMWDALSTNRRSPLQNRVLQSVYPPGSVWKLVMAALLLESGVKPYESVYCPGYVNLGEQVFRCWKGGGHGHQNMMDAIVNSCDSYFYTMSDRLNIDKIEQFARNCGFGKLTGIALPYENRGLVPSKTWKLKRFNVPWVRGDNYNTSIGQGFTLVTPVQMAVYVSALLNGGKLLKPQVLDNAPVEIVGNIPVSLKNLNFLVEAMRRTANGGTAKVVGRSDADMGGKTGTAQVTKLKMKDNKRLKTADTDYFERDHAWIATWGYKNGKSYVVIVMVEHGGGGSAVAGPVAQRVYTWLFGEDEKIVAKKNQTTTEKLFQASKKNPRSLELTRTIGEKTAEAGVHIE